MFNCVSPNLLEIPPNGFILSDFVFLVKSFGGDFPDKLVWDFHSLKILSVKKGQRAYDTLPFFQILEPKIEKLIYSFGLVTKVIDAGAPLPEPSLTSISTL